MNREDYLEAMKTLADATKQIESKKQELKELYIRENKPCELDQNVKIILGSGRKVTGLAKSFGILSDKNVHITSYKNGAKTMYITTPHKEVEILN